MIYLAFVLNALFLAAFVYELREARKERQALALLIKSRDVGEYVHAEMQLARPEETKEPEDTTVDLLDADPEQVARGLSGKPISE